MRNTIQINTEIILRKFSSLPENGNGRIGSDLIKKIRMIVTKQYETKVLFLNPWNISLSNENKHGLIQLAKIHTIFVYER